MFQKILKDLGYSDLRITFLPVPEDILFRYKKYIIYSNCRILLEDELNSRVMIIPRAIFGIDVCKGWPGGWWTSSDEKNVRKAAGG